MTYKIFSTTSKFEVKRRICCLGTSRLSTERVYYIELTIHENKEVGGR